MEKFEQCETSEIISFAKGEVKIETDADGKPAMLTGYAATFGNKSNDLGGWKAVISKGAFDNVMSDDVVCVFNHSRDYLLGRTSSGTVSLSLDDVGLKYTVKLPNTQLGRDMAELVARGDIVGSSFKANVKRGSIKLSKDKEGFEVHTFDAFENLIDVSPCTIPAFSDTSVEIKMSLEKRKLDQVRMSMNANRVRLAEIE